MEIWYIRVNHHVVHPVVYPRVSSVENHGKTQWNSMVSIHLSINDSIWCVWIWISQPYFSITLKSLKGKSYQTEWTMFHSDVMKDRTVVWNPESNYCKSFGYGSIPIHTIFRGMNIHLPAILMFTRGIRFWPIPISLIWSCYGDRTEPHQAIIGISVRS